MNQARVAALHRQLAELHLELAAAHTDEGAAERALLPPPPPEPATRRRGHRRPYVPPSKATPEATATAREALRRAGLVVKGGEVT